MAQSSRAPNTLELAQLLSLDDVPWVLLSRDGDIERANAPALELLQLSAEQATGLCLFSDGWEIDDAEGTPLSPRAWPHLQVRQTGRALHEVVLRARRLHSGPSRWLRMSALPRNSAAGELESILVAIVDVTDSRPQASPSLDAMLRASPGGMFRLVRRDHGADFFVFLDERVAALFDVTVANAFEDPDALWSKVHEDDAPGVLHADDRGEWTGDLRLPEPGITVRCRAVLEERGGVCIWNGMMWDVSKEIRLQEELRHAKRREVVGDLVAGVSHNFNNVLSAIVPNLETCLEETTGDLHEMIGDALQAARGAEHLVRQLVITTGRNTEAEREPLHVATVVREVAGLCHHSFPDEIAIRTVIHEESCYVLARPGDLHQVLLNLCLNARDALRGVSEPLLLIEVEVDMQRGTEDIVVRVTDNGAGMAENTRKRLGEPFFTTKAAGVGTGLGLASAFAIIRALDGEVQCTSRLSAGTRFDVRIPRKVLERARDPHSEVPRHDYDGRRALVIDDDVLVRRSMRRQLRSLGLKVCEAGSGEEAMRRLATEDVAVVFLDLTAHPAAAEELLRAIRREHSALPVVLVTGQAKHPSNMRTANAFVTKPVAYETLREALYAGLEPPVANSQCG